MNFDFLIRLFKKPTNKENKNENPTSPINLKIDKESSDLLIEKGKKKLDLGDYDGAVTDFTISIEMNPSNARAYLARSKAKMKLLDIDGAESDQQKAKQLVQNLEDGIDYYEKGKKLQDSERYSESIVHYDKALSLIPTLTSIFYLRGESKYFLKDYNGAIKDFDLSIHINASNKSDAYYQRGKIKSSVFKEKDEALKDLNCAIDLNPNNPDYYYSRAILLNDADAILDLNKAIEIDPEDADFYLARSLRKNGIDDIQGGILDITKYIELNQDGYLTISEAYSLRAGMRILLDDISGALKDHDLAINSDPLSSNAFLERGMTNQLNGNFDEAISDFSKAIELNPNNPNAYYKRGVLKQNINKTDEGIMDVIKAKTLGYGG